MDQRSLLFAGQGAQEVGMGKEIYETSARGREVFDRAASLLGPDFLKVCFEGPLETLTDTSWAQPAIFIHSLAAWEIVRERQPEISVQAMAGLSLGEITALTAAGWLTFEDGLRLVRKRGELMQQACLSTRGGMAAVLGMEVDALKPVCDESGIDVANLNCPGQIVISGDTMGIEKATGLAREKGAKKVIPLTVAGAYHSRLMQSAAGELEKYLQTVKVTVGSVPVISNVTAQPHEKDPAKVKATLVRQVTSSVRWEDSIRYLIAQGSQRMLELGPGEALAGFLKRIDRGVKITSVGKPADLEKLDAVAV